MPRNISEFYSWLMLLSIVRLDRMLLPTKQDLKCVIYKNIQMIFSELDTTVTCISHKLLSDSLERSDSIYLISTVFSTINMNIYLQQVHARLNFSFPLNIKNANDICKSIQPHPLKASTVCHTLNYTNIRNP